MRTLPLPDSVLYLLDLGLTVEAAKELRACEGKSLSDSVQAINEYLKKPSKAHEPAGPSEIVLGIAGMLDGNSVFMGGPSRISIRKAEKIVDYLRESGVSI
jgi:hypothetical protein